MGEHVYHGAAGIFHEEATDAPWLVGERIHNAQSAAHSLGMCGVNCIRVADVDPEARRRVLHSSWRDEDLSSGVGRRGDAKDWIFHRDLEPEDLDVEVPGSGQVISIGVSNDSFDHRNRMTAARPRRLGRMGSSATPPGTRAGCPGGGGAVVAQFSHPAGPEARRSRWGSCGIPSTGLRSGTRPGTSAPSPNGGRTSRSPFLGVRSGVRRPAGQRGCRSRRWGAVRRCRRRCRRLPPGKLG